MKGTRTGTHQIFVLSINSKNPKKAENTNWAKLNWLCLLWEWQLDVSTNTLDRCYTDITRYDKDIKQILQIYSIEITQIQILHTKGCGSGVWM